MTLPVQRVVLHTEDDPLGLACGRTLAPVEVAFTTYGDLDPDRGNAVFVCHALTGDAHSREWWRTMVGPGRPVDTDRFFVITPNLLGGCRGTTGPRDMTFPPLAIPDLVAVHRRLLEHLGVDRLFGAIGGSMGGMQVLQWLLDAPGQIERAAIIAASARLSPQNLAFSAAARAAILADSEHGMAIARRIGHITYLSETGMDARFARGPETAPIPADAREWLSSRYAVETYLDHQAETFMTRFDPLTYLWLSRIMDAFDPFAAGSAVDPATRALVLSFTSDWRFGPAHGDALAAGLRSAGAGTVERVIVPCDGGHDSFLLTVPGYQEAVAAFLAA